MLGGPTLNPPLTHVLPHGHRRLASRSTCTRTTRTRPSNCSPRPATRNLTLKFLYRNATEGSSKAFQTIQQDLSKVGIKVVGVPSPNADFYMKYLQVPSVAQRGVWDLSLAGWGADWYGNAALSFFKPLFSGEPSFPPIGSNFGLYNSPTDQRADRAGDRSAPTEDEADGAVGQGRRTR